MMPDWIDEFAGAVTLCDTQGIILYMNRLAVELFADDGGEALIGSNLLDCHPEPSRSKLAELLRNENKNIYTIEKHGKKKFIYQAPWYESGRYAGLVELSLEIPFDLPHFVRDTG